MRTENGKGLTSNRSFWGRSARASPSPHHTLAQERTARFTAGLFPPWHGGYPANTKSCSLGLQRISLILESISTNDTGSWSNVFNIRLHWSKQIKQKARINQWLTGKKRSSERERTSAGEGGKTAQTVLNNVVSYGELGARKRRWNNTEHCHEAKLTWAVGKEAFK